MNTTSPTTSTSLLYQDSYRGRRRQTAALTGCGIDRGIRLMLCCNVAMSRCTISPLRPLPDWMVIWFVFPWLSVQIPIGLACVGSRWRRLKVEVDLDAKPAVRGRHCPCNSTSTDSLSSCFPLLLYTAQVPKWTQPSPLVIARAKPFEVLVKSSPNPFSSALSLALSWGISTRFADGSDASTDPQSSRSLPSYSCRLFHLHNFVEDSLP